MDEECLSKWRNVPEPEVVKQFAISVETHSFRSPWTPCGSSSGVGAWHQGRDAVRVKIGFLPGDKRGHTLGSQSLASSQMVTPFCYNHHLHQSQVIIHAQLHINLEWVNVVDNFFCGDCNIRVGVVPASPQEQVHGSQLNPSVRFQEVLLHPLAWRPLVKMSDLTPSLFALGWGVLNLYGTRDIHHT